jgi:hypothetical protein
LKVFRGMKVIRALPPAGAEADLYVVDAPEGVRVLRLERGAPSVLPEVAARLDAIADCLGEGIVRTFGRGTDGGTGRRYELQEYLPLGDLSGLMARGQFPERDVLALAGSLSRTLDLLHSRGIVHRDVKPSNILLRSLDPPVPALCDFGISSALAPGVSMKLTRAAFTALYTAPESFADFAGAAGDFWSLGAVLLEAATGHHPLDGLPLAMVMRELTTRGLAVPDWLPADVRRILRGLLERDDKVRWRRAQVADALAGRCPGLPPRRTAQARMSDTAQARFSDAAQASLTDTAEVRWSDTAASLSDGSGGLGVDRAASLSTMPAPFLIMDDEFVTPEELAEWFNRDGRGWEAGAAAMRWGSVERWLRDTGRAEAADRMEPLSGTPHEMLFGFMRIFAPESPPAFRGVPLDLESVEALVRDRKTLSGDALATLDGILDGTLRKFPEIAAIYGRPLHWAVELALSSASDIDADTLDAETLACAFAAMRAPGDFFFGFRDYPSPREALAFVLKARCPLLTREWLCLWWNLYQRPMDMMNHFFFDGPDSYRLGTVGFKGDEIRRYAAEAREIARRTRDSGYFTFRKALEDRPMPPYPAFGRMADDFLFKIFNWELDNYKFDYRYIERQADEANDAARLFWLAEGEGMDGPGGRGGAGTEAGAQGTGLNRDDA